MDSTSCAIWFSNRTTAIDITTSPGRTVPISLPIPDGRGRISPFTTFQLSTVAFRWLHAVQNSNRHPHNTLRWYTWPQRSDEPYRIVSEKHHGSRIIRPWTRHQKLIHGGRPWPSKPPLTLVGNGAYHYTPHYIVFGRYSNPYFARWIPERPTIGPLLPNNNPSRIVGTHLFLMVQRPSWTKASLGTVINPNYCSSGATTAPFPHEAPRDPRGTPQSD